MLLNTENILNPQFSMKSTISINSLSIPEDVLKQRYLKNHLSTREIAKEIFMLKNQTQKIYF